MGIFESEKEKMRRAIRASEVPPVRPGVISSDSGSSGQVSLKTNIAVQIFNPRHRCSVKITNLSNVDVYIGFNQNVTVNSGDLLLGARGAFLVVDTCSALWAIGAIDGARVSFLEYL